MNSVNSGLMRIYAPDGSAGSPRSAQPAAAGAFRTDRFLPGGIVVHPRFAGNRTASPASTGRRELWEGKTPPFSFDSDHTSYSDLMSKGD
jgi:hypothetical protein